MRVSHQEGIRTPYLYLSNGSCTIGYDGYTLTEINNCQQLYIKVLNMDTSVNGDNWVGTTGCCWCHSDQPTVRSVFNLGLTFLLTIPCGPYFPYT